MRQKYDLIFPIGASCGCSQALRHAGLQHISLPFDWTAGRDLSTRADRIREEFAGWFERDTFELVTVPKFGHDTYWRDKWGFVPLHDLNTSQPLESQLPAVRAKYERRIRRLFRLIAGSRRVLAVHLDDPLFVPANADDARHVHDVLSAKWPGTEFDVLVLKNERGRALADRQETSGEGWRIVTFDCLRYDEQPQGVLDYRKVGDWLATEYDVIDYRTPEERRQASRKRRAAAYAKMGAASFWGYCWNKAQYKLYKHLKKDLARRGVA